jgi:hypothetical protein
VLAQIMLLRQLLSLMLMILKLHLFKGTLIGKAIDGILGFQKCTKLL